MTNLKTGIILERRNGAVEVSLNGKIILAFLDDESLRPHDIVNVVEVEDDNTGFVFCKITGKHPLRGNT